MKRDDNVLVNPLTQSLNDNVEDLLADIAEVTIDAFLDEGLLKDIPFASAVLSVFKIGNSIKELSYKRKLALFIQKLNNGISDEREKQKYIRQIEEGGKKSKRQLEYILLMIDRFIQPEKSQQLAKLYLSYLRNDISWISLCQYSEVLDRLLPGDISCLDTSTLSDKNIDELSKCTLQRLQGLGLIVSNTVPGAYDVHGNVIATRDDGTYSYTLFGRKFYQILIDNI